MPSPGSLPPTAAVVALLAVTVGTFAVSPYLVRLLRETRPLPTELRSALGPVCRRAGVEPGAVRIVGGDDTSDAFATGLLPGSERVFLTERLVAEFSPGEVEALVAHELAHVRKRHLWQRCGMTVVAGGVWLAVSARLGVGFGGGALLTHGAFLAFYLLVVLGALGLYQEYASDAYAARYAGRDVTVAALRRLRRDAPTDPFARVYDRVSLHPALAQRIERLRQVGAEQ